MHHVLRQGDPPDWAEVVECRGRADQAWEAWHDRMLVQRAILHTDGLPILVALEGGKAGIIPRGTNDRITIDRLSTLQDHSVLAELVWITRDWLYLLDE